MVDRSLSRGPEDQSAEILKMLVGVLLGLACLLGGWIVFAANGFYSPTLFLTGTITLPLGVLLLGTSLTGGLGKSPGRILADHLQQERKRRSRLD